MIVRWMSMRVSQLFERTKEPTLSECLDELDDELVDDGKKEIELDEVGTRNRYHHPVILLFLCFDDNVSLFVTVSQPHY